MPANDFPPWCKVNEGGKTELSKKINSRGKTKLQMYQRSKKILEIQKIRTLNSHDLLYQYVNQQFIIEISYNLTQQISVLFLHYSMIKMKKELDNHLTKIQVLK